MDDRYKRLRAALSKDEELSTVLMGQAGALRKAQAAAADQLAISRQILDDGSAFEEAAYAKVEEKARASRDVVLAALQADYLAVQTEQGKKVAEAAQAVAVAEAAVKALRTSIEKDWGVTVPSGTPTSNTIRIG